VINAAIALIVERGFAHTTMADVAARAGLTRGAIQHHFQNRVDLVRAIISDVEKDVVDLFSAAAPAPNVSIERRIEILIDGLGAVVESPSYRAAMDIWFTSRSDPDLRDAAFQSFRRYSDHLRDLWRSTFGKEVPEQAIADCRRVVVAVARGVVVSRIISPDAKPTFVTQTFATTRTMVKQYLQAAIKQKERK
jgi:AcrR family transcriptional regulator